MNQTFQCNLQFSVGSDPSSFSLFTLYHFVNCLPSRGIVSGILDAPTPRVQRHRILHRVCHCTLPVIINYVNESTSFSLHPPRPQSFFFCSDCDKYQRGKRYCLISLREKFVFDTKTEKGFFVKNVMFFDLVEVTFL